MPTSKELANLGLAKIGASRVNSLSPAVSPLEICIANGYTAWKRSEISKRRWVFATESAKITAQPETVVDPSNNGRIYKFNLPGSFIRALRNNGATWVQRGQFLYADTSTLVLEYLYEPADNLLIDDLFNEVLACRIAFEAAEPATQSASKKREAAVYYQTAMQEAARNNAFTLDKQSVNDDDAGYSWIMERLYPSA